MPIRKPFCETEKDFVKLLDATLKAKGLSRERLSKETNVSPSSLSHLFNMSSFLSLPAIERICQYLNIGCIPVSGVVEPDPIIIPLEVWEKNNITKALKFYNWDVDAVAKKLAVSKYYIYTRIQKFDIKKNP